VSYGCARGRGAEYENSRCNKAIGTWKASHLKFFLDTELIEKEWSLALISLGVVSEDDREFYAISTEFNPDDANEWVRDNVLPHLEPPNSGLWKPLNEIRAGLLDFIGTEYAEFWASGGAHDWVAVTHLMGGITRIPTNWWPHINELRQWWMQLGKPHYPAQTFHHALQDARLAKRRFEALDQSHQST
jgi:hypothetical protein